MTTLDPTLIFAYDQDLAQLADDVTNCVQMIRAVATSDHPEWHPLQVVDTAAVDMAWHVHPLKVGRIAAYLLYRQAMAPAVDIRMSGGCADRSTPPRGG